MNSLRPLATIACLLLSWISTSISAEEPQRATKTEMKGMELYSWRDSTTKEWRFSLLPGTNAKKANAHIIDAETAIKTVAELKARLAALAIGEYLAWNFDADPKVFVLPPKDVVQQITAFCKAKEIKLSLKDE
jgi:hypothetical protein